MEKSVPIKFHGIPDIHQRMISVSNLPFLALIVKEGPDLPLVYQYIACFCFVTSRATITPNTLPSSFL
jgi:hypothetical protein